jgi:O-antigen/teichoic acid export membrane protein
VRVTSQAVAVERSTVRGRERGRAIGGAWLLSAATLASGVLAYAFMILAARTLGADAFGRIGALWAALFLGVIVLFRPLEQTTSRSVADRRARGEEVRTVVRSVSVIYLLMLVGLGLAAVAGWAEIRDHLFDGSQLLTALLFAGIAGYGVQYVVRGLCSGIQWFEGYGILLMADALVRLAVALPLVVAAVEGTAAAACAAAGIAGGLAPLWFGRRRLSRAFAAGSGSQFHVGAALAFAGPASVIAIADQVLVNGGPLLVMLEGGKHASKTAGIVFAATMLVRVPVYVFQGIAASLLPNLTQLQANDDTALFRRTMGRAAVVLTATTAVIVAGVASIGPTVMPALFGSDFAVGRAALTYLGFGVGLYLASATVSQALLALDRGIAAAACWTSGSVVFIALYLLLPGSALTRTAEGFAAGMGTVLVLLVAAVAKHLRR